MKRFDATHYSTENYYHEDDFSMEQPVLPEDRRKTSGWVIKESDTHILDIDQFYMGA